jgi:hypothetical protein
MILRLDRIVTFGIAPRCTTLSDRSLRGQRADCGGQWQAAGACLPARAYVSLCQSQFRYGQPLTRLAHNLKACGIPEHENHKLDSRLGLSCSTPRIRGRARARTHTHTHGRTHGRTNKYA